MQKIFINKIKQKNVFLLGIFFAFLIFLLPKQSFADVLLPGDITTCGELMSSGTYNLKNDVTENGTSTCFTVGANAITINGGGHTITGVGAVAIDARARVGGPTSALAEGSNGYTNLIVNDITITGFTTGINTSGNSDSSGSGTRSGYGGDAGDLAVYYSKVGTIVEEGGNTTTYSYGGLGGNILFTNTDLDISNSTLSTLGGSGTVGRNSSGGLTLSYTGALTKDNVSFSSLSYFNNNSASSSIAYGVYAGGTWPIFPGSVSTCGTLLGTGTYTLAGDLTSSSTCFLLSSDSITINGGGHSIISATSTNTSFAINAGAYASTTLASTTVTGYSNLITSSSSVAISGTDLNLATSTIYAGNLTITGSNSLNLASSTITASGIVILAGSLNVASSSFTASTLNIGYTTSVTGQNTVTISNLNDLIINGFDYGSRIAGLLTYDYWKSVAISYNWRSIASSADGMKLVAVANVGSGEYIYTSADGGTTWVARTSAGSRIWLSVTSSADGTKLVAAVNNGYIYTSTDSGNTWIARIGSGSHQWYSITSSADGTKLAAAVSSGYIYTSIDSGATWATSTNAGLRNWYSIASSADGTKLAAAVNNGYIYINKLLFQPVSVDILLPQSGDNAVWSPIVSWGTAKNCYYSYDNFTSTSTANCALNGSDITRPTSFGSKTLYIKGIDAVGNVATRQTGFNYINRDILFISPQNIAYSDLTWNPSINYSVSNRTLSTCQYSYNNFASTTNVNCSLNGADIVRPSFGPNTLYIKTTDASSTINIASTTFTYLGSWSTSANAGVRAWSSIASSADGMKLVAGTDDGNIFRSTDGGVTWPTSTYFVNTSWNLLSSSADGKKILAHDSRSGDLWLSTDSGASWTDIPDTAGWVWDTIKVSANGNKFIAADDMDCNIWTSSDGLSWTENSTAGSCWNNLVSSDDGSKLAISDESNGSIWTSNDGGSYWVENVNTSGYFLSSISSDSTGTKLSATGNNGHVYTSINSGGTWVDRTPSSGGTWLKVLESSDGTKLFVMKSDGTNLLSNDFGLTWSQYLSNGDNAGNVVANSSLNKFFNSKYNGSIYTADLQSSSSANICTINSPALNSSVAPSSWLPSVYWGPNRVLCQYSYNNFASTTNADCSLGGSDILAPLSFGNNTLYIRSSDASNNTGTSSVLFNYLSSIWTLHNTGGLSSWVSITSSADGTKLAAVNNAAGYVYTSTDSGNTWTARTGTGSLSWQSITSSADGTKLAAAVSNGYVYTSTDGGATWATSTNAGLRFWYSIASSADGTKLAAVATNGYIYTSTNSGATWATSTNAGSNFWYSIASSADGTKLVAAPGATKGYIYISTDSGATWSTSTNSELYNWNSIASSADGAKLAAAPGSGPIYTYVNQTPNISVSILLPQVSNVLSAWAPIVSWSTAVSCYYSYNNFTSTSTANCGSLGSDIIPPPTAGTSTLYIKGVDVSNAVSIASTTFSYTPYYWCGTADSNWTNVSNWYTTNACSVNIGSIPGSANGAVLLGSVSPVIATSSTVLPLAIDSTGLTGGATATGVIFSGTVHNTARVTGNATFNNSAYNAGTITGNVTFNNTAYNTGTIIGNAVFSTASSSRFNLSNNMIWGGTISGTIKGSDNSNITSFIFNNTSSNSTTITSTTTTIFNDGASNNGTINGDATFNNTSPFNVGTVNGTVTLSGTNQTILGINSVTNFIKQLLSTDSIFFGSGGSLNVSGLFRLLGFNASSLLNVRSTTPGSSASLGINGTSDFNFLRIKDIHNTGANLDLSSKTVYDDSGNSGFTFPANSSAGSRSGGLAYSYTAPVLPASHTPAPAPSTQSSVSNNNTRAGAGSRSFFQGLNLNNLTNLSLKNLPTLGGLNLTNNIGVSNFVNPLAGLVRLNPLSGLGSVPFVSIIGQVNNFLNSSFPKRFIDITNAVPSISRELSQANVNSGYELSKMSDSPINTPTLRELADNNNTRPDNLIFISVDGVQQQTRLSVDEKGNTYQIINVDPYSALVVTVKDTSKTVSASFDGKVIKANKDKNSIITVNLQAPKSGDKHTLKINGAILEIRVNKPVVVSPTAQAVKQKSPLQKLWSWFSK